MPLTPKEINYFESQLPEGSKVVLDYTGFLETFYEIVTHIERIAEFELEDIDSMDELNRETYKKFFEKYDLKGIGYKWELAQDLTEQFQELHKSNNWEDGDFFDEVGHFVQNKLKELED